MAYIDKHILAMYEGIMKYNWDRFGDGLGGFIEERYK